MNPHISKLRKFFINKCNEIDNKIICRKRSLDSKKLLARLFQMASNNIDSSAITDFDLECDDIIDVSRQAIEKKLELLDNILLNDILIALDKHINQSDIFKDRHIFAIDGTKISLNKKVDGFHLIGNENYKKALINTLYSVNNRIPINFDLSNDYNEIESFLKNLFQYMKKNDILIADRGYYSKELIKSINDKGCFFICRMKKNSLLVQDMPKNEQSIIRNLDGYGKIRIIKYTIEVTSKGKTKLKTFYLSTNLFDNDINYFKEMYHNRWYIEEFFKTIKHELSLSLLSYKKINRIKQNINIRFILVVLTRYIEQLSIKYVGKLKDNYKINHKVALHGTGIRIMQELLFEKSNKEIIKIISILNKKTYYNEPNRHFKRIRITPTSKWYSQYHYSKNAVNSKKNKNDKNNKNIKVTKNTKNNKNIKDTKNIKNNKSIKDTKNIKVTKNTKNNKNIKDTKNTEHNKNIKDTKNIKDIKNTENNKNIENTKNNKNIKKMKIN